MPNGADVSLTAVVILAAGRGERMGDTAHNGPKQYRHLGDKAILQHTIEKFAGHGAIDVIQVVIHPDDHQLYHQAVSPTAKLAPPVHGGWTRQASGLCGLKALQSDNIGNVLIHDAARPFVSEETITQVIGSIRPGLCALPGTRISDTLKRVGTEGQVLETVDRNGLFAAQTPQGFVYDEILQAHLAAGNQGLIEFTDDAAVAEWHGLSVNIVKVGLDNMKVTTPDDLETANKLARLRRSNHMTPDIRVGNGYDIHTFEPGDHVVLCGVDIPFHQKLKGHSDADVGLHALTDALLATLADGDIGSHFPPSDPRWKDAKSDQFLRYAVDLVNEGGGRITLLDVTLICEQPKIGKHRQAMREKIAEITAVQIDRISVKATTNEGIGAVGRKEGIAALATATVAFSPSDQVMA